MSMQGTTQSVAAASRRRIPLQLGALGIVIAGAYSLGYWRNQAPAPVLAPSVSSDEGFVGFEPMAIDLGDQAWYAEVPFGLEFFNGGDAPVTVGRIESGCACTVMDRESYDGVIVAPGDVLPLEGTLEVPGREGPFRVTVDLVLASGEMYSATVRLHVFSTYAIKPASLDFGVVDLAHEHETFDPVRKAVFTSDSASIVGDPVTDSPWVEALLIDQGAGETEIVVQIDREHLRYGRQAARVSVSLDDPYQPVVTIPVFAQGALAVRPIPSHVFLRGKGPQVVRLVAPDGSQVRAMEARCDVEALTVWIDDAGHVVLANPSDVSLPQAVAAWVTSVDGNVARVLVSTVR